MSANLLYMYIDRKMFSVATVCVCVNQRHRRRTGVDGSTRTRQKMEIVHITWKKATETEVETDMKGVK